MSNHLSLMENLDVSDNGEAATAENTNSNTNTEFSTLLISKSALCLSLESRVKPPILVLLVYMYNIKMGEKYIFSLGYLGLNPPRDTYMSI